MPRVLRGMTVVVSAGVMILAIASCLRAQFVADVAAIGTGDWIMMVNNRRASVVLGVTHWKDYELWRADYRQRSPEATRWRHWLPRYEGRAASTGTRSIRTWEIETPYWMILLLSAVAPARWLHNRRRANRGARLGLCPKCGYDLRATPDRCPECGTAKTQDLNHEATKTRSDPRTPNGSSCPS